MQLTQEQQAILAAARDSDDNLLIRARAGSGKTTTLLQLLDVLRGTSILTAYNKSIANELKAKAERLSLRARMNTSIGTAHSIGLGLYRAGSGIKSPKVSGGKVSFMLTDWLDARPRDADYFRKGKYLIKNLIGHAKNAGFGVVSRHEAFPAIVNQQDWINLLEHFNMDMELDSAGISTERAIELARQLLLASNQRLAQIDFDDMIYLPLLLNMPTGGAGADNVLIDEAQDISATRRELCFRLSRRRIIAVGDEHQAIYGFTGADAQSLANIGRRASAVTLPLSICWRCDADIIGEAQREVPDIVCRPGAPAGRVASVSMFDIASAFAGSAVSPAFCEDNLPQRGDAILCRLNRPNVSMALLLLKAGLPAKIEGRDLGSKLLSHTKAAEPLYASKSIHELIIAVEDYGEQQVSRLLAAERTSSADLLEDEIACAIVLMERCLEQGQTRFADLEDLINALFADDIPPGNTITLSSVHKSKGREWPRVFILGKGDYMPFWRAEADWELEQEHNLIYVAKTRAEKELIYISDVRDWLDSRKGA